MNITNASKGFVLSVSIILLGCGEDSVSNDPMPESPMSGATMTPADSGPGDDDADDPPGESGSDPGDGTTSSDDQTSGPASTSGDPPPSGESTGNNAGETGPGDSDLEVCLGQATNDCEICACNNCLAELSACEDDPGCIAVRMCAQETGCVGLGCLGVCGDVIEEAGGLGGESVMLALQLSDCYEAASCDTMCGE